MGHKEAQQNRHDLDVLLWGTQLSVAPNSAMANAHRILGSTRKTPERRK
jgi:hypothetical protein